MDSLVVQNVAPPMHTNFFCIAPVVGICQRTQPPPGRFIKPCSQLETLGSLLFLVPFLQNQFYETPPKRELTSVDREEPGALELRSFLTPLNKPAMIRPRWDQLNAWTSFPGVIVEYEDTYPGKPAVRLVLPMLRWGLRDIGSTNHQARSPNFRGNIKDKGSTPKSQTRLAHICAANLSAHHNKMLPCLKLASHPSRATT
jgi:hypothetical protein